MKSSNLHRKGQARKFQISISTAIRPSSGVLAWPYFRAQVYLYLLNFKDGQKARRERNERKSREEENKDSKSSFQKYKEKDQKSKREKGKDIPRKDKRDERRDAKSSRVERIKSKDEDIEPHSKRTGWKILTKNYLTVREIKFFEINHALS